MGNISVLCRFYDLFKRCFGKFVGIVDTLYVTALRRDHLFERFECGFVLDCPFYGVFALVHTSFARKIEHICGKYHTNLRKVLRTVTVESVDCLFHFERVAYRIAQRSVHIRDKRKHFFAGALSYLHHNGRKFSAVFERLCKSTASRLDIEHYTIVVGGKFFAHNAGNNERQRINRCRNVAKRIQLLVGRCEIAVLTDGSVDVRWIAADLLSQAEHGSGYEKSLCVCTSAKQAEAIRAEVLRQTETLSRKALVQRVIDRDGILIVVSKGVAEGLEVVNRFAPEHFEIMTKDALKVMKGVRSAGAVFAGAWTPESAGDFVAGPSHVLPTGGAANMFNGLTPDDFRRRHSFVAFTQKDLAETKSTIEAFAAVEGLDGHGRAATIRFDV